MITCKKNDRLLELLWFVGYSIEFPTQLAVRIGGGAEWNRRVMYRAIQEGYVRLYRKQYMAALLFFSLSRRKNTTVYKATGKGNEYEKCGRLHLSAKDPELRIDHLKEIPEGVIAVELDQAIAKKLFGQTIAIRCFDNTVEHTVGEVNGPYWFKTDIGTQEGESNLEEEP